MSESTNTDTIYTDTNGFPMTQGRNLHMGTTKGEVANRIITVGPQARAELIAENLDASPAPIRVLSSRGFLTITGYYKGVHVSVCSIGMGTAMMDFFVREARAVVDGPMMIIRFGTCGGLGKDAIPGCVVVSSAGSAMLTRNMDSFIEKCDDKNSFQHYNLSQIIPSFSWLSDPLAHELRSCDERMVVVEGLDITSDSFYHSQGRCDPNFHDCNSKLIEDVISFYPNACSMQMETYMLYHLAHCSIAPIFGCSAALVLSNRLSAKVVDVELEQMVEKKGGLACLKAITSAVFP